MPQNVDVSWNRYKEQWQLREGWDYMFWQSQSEWKQYCYIHRFDTVLKKRWTTAGQSLHGAETSLTPSRLFNVQYLIHEAVSHILKIVITLCCIETDSPICKLPIVRDTGGRRRETGRGREEEEDDDVIIFGLCHGGAKWLKPSLLSSAPVSASELIEVKERQTAAAQSHFIGLDTGISQLSS